MVACSRFSLTQQLWVHVLLFKFALLTLAFVFFENDGVVVADLFTRPVLFHFTCLHVFEEGLRERLGLLFVDAEGHRGSLHDKRLVLFRNFVHRATRLTCLRALLACFVQAFHLHALVVAHHIQVVMVIFQLLLEVRHLLLETSIVSLKHLYFRYVLRHLIAHIFCVPRRLFLFFFERGHSQLAYRNQL